MTINIKHIANLANLNIPKAKLEEALSKFTSVLDIVSQLSEIDTKDVLPTSQVTGLENVWREDEVDLSRMLTQKEALGNAKNKKGGFFSVSRQINY